MRDVVGVVIDSGASDWQIFQQDRQGGSKIALAGRWGASGAEKATGIEFRLVHEDNGAPPARHLDWRPAQMRPDGTWSGVLKDVPAGGLYRLEMHLRTKENPAVEWSARGDMRHFLGVGDLWVIAGQSNSAGYGRGPCHDPPELGVHVLNNAMRWALATQPLNESTDTAHAANRERANSGHSPWLHWARLVKRRMNFPIGLIQCSLGGSALAPWNPTEPGDSPLFETMVQAVAAAGGKVRGVLWYQGESDAIAKKAGTYRKRFIAAVRAWRRALGNPSLAVLTVQINRAHGGSDESQDRNWSVLREAQRRVPHLLKGLTVTPALDLGLSDQIHTSPHGNCLLAERVALAALGAVYGRQVDYLAPEPAAARRTRSGSTVEIVFDHVASRIESMHATARPFRVEDAEGAAEIERIEYTGGTSVRLHLARRLKGRAVVHGGYGKDPAPVPYDVVRMMPMLGFSDFPVE